MPEYRGAGSFLYSEGHRICVSASYGKGLTKVGLQKAFGDFGHIYQIETPKPNLAFLAFAEKVDAMDALSSMDGKSIEGQAITVSWAGPKPQNRPVRESQVLTSTKFEREDIQAARANYRPPSPVRRSSRSRGRSEGRDRNDRGDRGDRGRRSRSRRRTRDRRKRSSDSR
mmetsp:Transcript_8051/g.18010  ORF Transcript_8051/g.18010 Transcript_8051/m.18010 type:complete len:170 (+) Transcript_8051:48-557(+)